MVRYTKHPNSLKPGTFFAKFQQGTPVCKEDLIREIAEKTLVHEVDVGAVINGMIRQITVSLLDGRCVNISDFVRFSLSLGLKDPDAFTRQSKDLAKEDFIVRVHASVRHAFVQKVRESLKVEEGALKVLKSQINTVEDLISGQEMRYAAGKLLVVEGQNMAQHAEFKTDPNQGVFFVMSDGAEHRADAIARAGSKLIHCMVPDAVEGEVTVVVRTRYSTTDELREAKLENVLPLA